MRWFSAVLIIGWAATFAYAQTSQSKLKSKDQPMPAPSDAVKIAGKSFGEWLKELAANKDPSKKGTAIRALCAFPPETSIKALPAFLVEMRKQGTSTPADLSVRCELCIAVAQLFGYGGKIEPKDQVEAVALLRNYLRDSQAILRFRALVALGAIGPDARAAIPEIVDRLRVEFVTWEVRQAIASALGSIAHDEKNGPTLAVLRSLYGLLHDPAYQVRLAAVQALSILGPHNTDTTYVDDYVNSLLPVATKDPEPGLQIWAHIAIIGATSDFSAVNIDPIAKHASSLDPDIRAQAVQALGTIGPNAKKHIPTLIAKLSDADTLVQSSAVWALSRMERSAVNALPALEKMTADPNLPDYIKRSAKDAMEKIKGK